MSFLILIAMSVKERTYEFIRYKGLKVSQFESMCDLSNGYVSSMRKGFGDDKLNNVLKMFPELNREWLLFGEGEMLFKNPSTATDTEEVYQTPANATLVPLVPLRGQAGSLTGFSDDGVRESECEMVISPVDNASFAISIYGDSMIPEYPSGCRVFVTQINPSSFIQWGNVFLLDTINGTILKEVQPAAEGYITCHSLNPSGRYKDFQVPLKDIRGMYRIVACVIPK